MGCKCQFGDSQTCSTLIQHLYFSHRLPTGYTLSALTLNAVIRCKLWTCKLSNMDGIPWKSVLHKSKRGKFVGVSSSQDEIQICHVSEAVSVCSKYLWSKTVQRKLCRLFTTNHPSCLIVPILCINTFIFAICCVPQTSTSWNQQIQALLYTLCHLYLKIQEEKKGTCLMF